MTDAVFGGPATSIAFSIIADVVPAQRRGSAMGKVMGAFSIASVLGVPAGLELARHFGWSAPFFAVAGLSRNVLLSWAMTLVVMAGGFVLIPNISAYVQFSRREAAPALA